MTQILTLNLQTKTLIFWEFFFFGGRGALAPAHIYEISGYCVKKPENYCGGACEIEATE